MTYVSILADLCLSWDCSVISFAVCWQINMNFWSFLKPSYCVQKCSQIICRPKPNLEAHTAARSEGVKESKISRVDLLPGLAGGRAGRQCGTCLADRDDDSEKSFQPASCCIGQVSTDEIWEVSAGVGWGGVRWRGGGVGDWLKGAARVQGEYRV